MQTMVSIEVAAAEPKSGGRPPRRSLKIVEATRLRGGAEGDDRLEDAEIVHELHQREEGRDGLEMRQHDVSGCAPSATRRRSSRFERVAGTVCRPA